MSYGNNEGPTAGMIPVRMYKTCQGCKFHDHRMVKSGNNPIYRNDCKHETAPRYSQFSMHGNLESEDGIVSPGDWCPFEAVNVNPNP